MKYFSSDWHLGHEKSIEFSGRPFDSLKDMHDHLWKQVESLKAGDVLYFLGDLGSHEKIIHEFFGRLPKRVSFHWILGNHDHKYKKFVDRCTSVSEIKSVKIEGNHVVLCHYPMVTWDKSHYGAWQLYGHHHINSHGTADLGKHTTGKQLNVNWEFHDYKLLSEQDVAAKMESLPENWDLIRRKQ